MFDRHSSIQKRDAVVYRDFSSGEGGVLLHLETGQYHGLNRTGSLIWDLIDGERTIEALVAELRARLDDPSPTLESDVIVFLDGARQRDLID